MDQNQKFKTKKNFGDGRQAKFAGKRAIRRHLHQQPASAVAHITRWKVFCKILYELFRIIDVCKVDNLILSKCAFYLRKKVAQGEYSVSYAQNVLSTANVVLRLMRRDKAVYISPAEYIGRRCRIRKTAPKGMDKSIIYAIGTFLRRQEKGLYAVIFTLIREFGLRKREACLFDAKTALEQAITLGKIRIDRGTKGGYGRKMKRWVVVKPHQISILEEAALLQGKSPSLVPKGKKLIQFIRRIDRYWITVRKGYDLGTMHDLRSCYACDRYSQLTGFPAPIFNDDKIVVDPNLDEEARKLISQELGHKRIDIISAYIGGRR